MEDRMKPLIDIEHNTALHAQFDAMNNSEQSIIETRTFKWMRDKRNGLLWRLYSDGTSNMKYEMRPMVDGKTKRGPAPGFRDVVTILRESEEIHSDKILHYRPIKYKNDVLISGETDLIEAEVDIKPQREEVLEAINNCRQIHNLPENENVLSDEAIAFITKYRLHYYHGRPQKDKFQIPFIFFILLYKKEVAADDYMTYSEQSAKAMENLHKMGCEFKKNDTGKQSNRCYTRDGIRYRQITGLSFEDDEYPPIPEVVRAFFENKRCLILGTRSKVQIDHKYHWCLERYREDEAFRNNPDNYQLVHVSFNCKKREDKQESEHTGYKSDNIKYGSFFHTTKGTMSITANVKDELYDGQFITDIARTRREDGKLLLIYWQLFKSTLPILTYDMFLDKIVPKINEQIAVAIDVQNHEQVIAAVLAQLGVP